MKLTCAYGRQPDFNVKKVLCSDSDTTVYLGRYAGFKTWCIVSVGTYEKERKTFSKHGLMYNTMVEAVEAGKEIAATFNLKF